MKNNLSPTKGEFLEKYIAEHLDAFGKLSGQNIANVIEIFEQAWLEERQFFVFGNGGSASNASHFITDLSKGASDKLPKRFKAMSLNDNTPWITALGNDYEYDQIFVRQLMNFARPGDIVMVMSVSGNSPNLIKAIEWSKQNGLFTIALLGCNESKLSELVDFAVPTASNHYGRVEDLHMGICHMICYYFMEEWTSTGDTISKKNN